MDVQEIPIVIMGRLVIRKRTFRIIISAILVIKEKSRLSELYFKASHSSSLFSAEYSSTFQFTTKVKKKTE